MLYTFSLQEERPPATLRQNITALHQAARSSSGDLTSLDAIQIYFQTLRLVKGSKALDAKGILEAFSPKSSCLLPFAKVGERFQLIDTPSRTVYIPIGEGKAICEQLLSGQVSQGLLRRAGVYGVTIYLQEYTDLEEYTDLVEKGIVVPICENSDVLTDTAYYDPETGLDASGTKLRTLLY